MSNDLEERARECLAGHCPTDLAKEVREDTAIVVLTTDALSAMIDFAKGGDWMPIEKAPKEIWAKSQQVICGHSEKRWIRFGRYYGELKRWYYSGTNERTQWSETPGDAPTHFRPMLEPPALDAPDPHTMDRVGMAQEVE